MAAQQERPAFGEGAAQRRVGRMGQASGDPLCGAGERGRGCHCEELRFETIVENRRRGRSEAEIPVAQRRGNPVLDSLGRRFAESQKRDCFAALAMTRFFFFVFPAKRPLGFVPARRLPTKKPRNGAHGRCAEGWKAAMWKAEGTIRMKYRKALSLVAAFCAGTVSLRRPIPSILVRFKSEPPRPIRPAGRSARDRSGRWHHPARVPIGR